MSAKIKVGVAGAGRVAKLAHLPAYNSDPRSNIRAIAEVDPARREDAATEYSITETYSDAEEMIQQEDLDIISICTPPFTHRDIFISAAKAGCDIYCEKPLCTSLSEANQMADAARENDTIVQVGYIYQYHPNFHRARDIIQNNILRDIEQANIVFGTSGPKEQGWRFDRDKNPQGILGEITTHLLDFYLSCFDGTPEVVSANLSSEKYSIIDEAELELHIGDTEINLVTNWTQVGNRVHNHIIRGKNGWIEITDQFLKGNINGEDINVKYGVSPTVDIRSADGKLFDLFLGKGEMDIQTKRIVDFIDHVAERNRETVAPIERGVNITKIVEDAYEKR